MPQYVVNTQNSPERDSFLHYERLRNGSTEAHSAYKAAIRAYGLADPYTRQIGILMLALDDACHSALQDHHKLFSADALQPE